jgi:two-component system cell cycle sensor histidine kinase/response regulator CckA
MTTGHCIRLAATILVNHGFTTHMALGGREALAMFGRLEGRIDLLLTDVMMPHMSGPELADRLVALEPGLKVLYMSGQEKPELGSLKFLRKPFSAAELVEAVRRRAGVSV